MPLAECRAEVKRFYTLPITNTITDIGNGEYVSKTNLNGRTSETKFKYKVGSSKNWKYFVGGGVIVGAVATGVLVYLVK